MCERCGCDAIDRDANDAPRALGDWHVHADGTVHRHELPHGDHRHEHADGTAHGHDRAEGHRHQDAGDGGRGRRGDGGR